MFTDRRRRSRPSNRVAGSGQVVQDDEADDLPIVDLSVVNEGTIVLLLFVLILVVRRILRLVVNESVLQTRGWVSTTAEHALKEYRLGSLRPVDMKGKPRG